LSVFDDYLHLAHRIDRRMAQKYVPRLEGCVLDVGCGRQPYRRFLRNGTRYVGMEYDTRLHPTVVGDVRALPFRDAVFNAVMCNEVLEHVPEPARALAEIHRVLRPGGQVYVTVPQSWGLHYEPHDFYRYTKYGMVYLLEHAGFRVTATERMGGLFSFFAVRLLDMLVLQYLFKLFDRIGFQRGRYRAAAVLALPFNALLGPVVTMLDHLDATNAYGWALLAEKGDHPEAVTA
jgi:SAM-dependent methyltransferase